MWRVSTFFVLPVQVHSGQLRSVAERMGREEDVGAAFGAGSLLFRVSLKIDS